VFDPEQVYVSAPLTPEFVFFAAHEKLDRQGRGFVLFVGDTRRHGIAGAFQFIDERPM
jgi:hypothetical protein